MPFLSRIRLNQGRSQTRRFLTDPQALHAAILNGLPTQPVRERILWRLDTDQAHRPSLVVLTQSPPSWEHLVEQAGWPAADDPDDPQVITRPYEPLLMRIAVGQSFAFRLTANPVVSTRRPERLTTAQRNRFGDEGPARSRQVAHRTVTHQVDWLLQRQNRLGFVVSQARASHDVGELVPDLRVLERTRRTFRRRGAKNPITIQMATYEGRLDVRDVDLLRRAMTEGIGRAKAYGCGLMTLASIPDLET